MGSQYTPNQIITGASNVKTGTNPAFTAEDFYNFYPQFSAIIDDSIVTQFIAMAGAVVKEVRWHEQWSFGMCLFVAHFVTLYLQASDVGDYPSAKQVVAAAQARGLQTSKRVGEVSVSYDFSHINQDLQGWVSWKSTQYGVQFASIARLLGKAGMGVW